MFDGKAEMLDRMAWNHTAAILTKIHNVNCTKQSEMQKVRDNNPYATQDRLADAMPLDEDARALMREAYKR